MHVILKFKYLFIIVTQRELDEIICCGNGPKMAGRKPRSKRWRRKVTLQLTTKYEELTPTLLHIVNSIGQLPDSCLL